MQKSKRIKTITVSSVLIFSLVSALLLYCKKMERRTGNLLSEKLKNELLEKYDKEHEYELNERFSTKGWQMVFTKSDDKDHWLVFEKKSANEIEVHRTDGTGFITDRDCYSVLDDKLKLAASESYVKDRTT